MRGVRVLGGLVSAIVALGALLGAWLQPSPDLDEGDARTVAEESLGELGFESVEVADDVEWREYEPAAGGTIPAWRTVSTVEGGVVELWVAVSDGAAVFLDDRTTDETAQLLTDEQFDELSSLRINPATDRQQRRNILVTVAAAAVVLLGVVLASAPEHLDAPRKDRKDPPR